MHFQPEKNGMNIRFRTDGVLHHIGIVPAERTGQIRTGQIVARLKVLADLLTYKTNVPQEGRVRAGRVPNIVKEMRISTTPTLHGERVVIRFFSEERSYHYPDKLGFPGDIQTRLLHSIRKNSGAVLIAGPAGSGKTTTAYALLRELADRGETLRSIVTLEDPIEHALDGIAQIEVSSQGDRSLGETIKYMMRQDPEVLFVGEIRDRQTAESAFQAVLTGHLLLTTFHAGSAAEAVGRLCELGIEPFVLRSGISCVLSQRLVRKLCECAESVVEPLHLTIGKTEYNLQTYRHPKGCEQCGGTGYRGRIPLAEALPLENDDVMRNLLDRNDTVALRETAIRNGMIPLGDRAFALIELGMTSPLEIRRVFG
ncbi:MAG: Flp pilus assembly complex ATPase component TadA [Planctomycetaceae bacterium]|nr:Flp pilus assembly complex ATPase component TadA [Planctomycetaceae bacterium]